jgi:pSer/pThr/pTyr-binding forkhead associated (FHA) protein
VLPKHAVLQMQPDGQVVIRKANPSAEVLINGVRLGAEPTPLLHGDKVDIGGHELTFVDERRSGSTQYIPAMKAPEVAAEIKAGAAQASKATANTGGRLVSLTDGREYVVAGASLVFGREAGCDVVVAGKDVSRRHAEIVQTPKGYLLVDSSTNGTFVNEERVQGQRILARADVVRIGDESFRFYADLAASKPAAPPAPPPPPPAPPGPPPGPASAPQAAPQAAGGARSSAAVGRPSQVGPLASLLVKSGALKGQRYQIKTPVVNIGRADYNDLVLTDPSVSTAHAKLQRREGVWVVVDLDSTNGTFVDGERIKADAPIAPGTSLRFGDVSLVFEPTDDALGVEKGGGTVVLSTLSPPAMAGAPSAPPPSRAATAPPPAPKPAPKAPARPPAKAPVKKAPAAEKKGKGCGAGVIVLALGTAGVLAIVRWILA